MAPHNREAHPTRDYQLMLSGELSHLLTVYENNIIPCYLNDVALCFEL